MVIGIGIGIVLMVAVFLLVGVAYQMGKRAAIDEMLKRKLDQAQGLYRKPKQ